MDVKSAGATGIYSCLPGLEWTIRFCSSKVSLFRKTLKLKTSANFFLLSFTHSHPSIRSTPFLCFAVYVIYKKNYSFSTVYSGVKFLFFYLTKTANSFYSKINDSSMVRTTAFSSSRLYVRVSVVPNIFTIYSWRFLMPEISETLKGSFTKFFGTVRQKIFDGNLWYPLLCIKVFDTPNFLRHWRDAHEIFRHCETKNFLRKILILPPPSLIQTFSIPEIIATVKDSSKEIFGTVRQKIFDGKSWYSPPLSYPNFFDTRN